MPGATIIPAEPVRVRKHSEGSTPLIGPATNRAYLAIALGLGATAGWGFWPTYFGPLLRGGVNRHWIIHVHAAVFIGWLLPLMGQVGRAIMSPFV